MHYGRSQDQYRLQGWRYALLGSVSIVGLMLPTVSEAQDATWIGNSTDWNDASNWSGGTVPSGVARIDQTTTQGLDAVLTDPASIDKVYVGRGNHVRVDGGTMTITDLLSVSQDADPSGASRFSVENGGSVVTNRVFVGDGFQPGYLAVRGTGSSFTALLNPGPSNVQFAVGGRREGTLEVSDGGTVNVGVDGRGVLNVGQYDAAGTVRIGTGGASGTLNAGQVLFGPQGGRIIFNHSDTLTFATTIDGMGQFVQEGSGTTILTGTNTYSGATTISAGTLQVGNGGTTGTLGSGNVINDAALVFNRSNAITVDNAISGSGTLTQTGSGTLTLSGINTYTGGTTITGGVLSVSADANLGDPSGRLTLDGGTLENTAAFTSARNVVLGDNGGTFKTNASLGLTGTISGDGLLNKGGTGTLTLSGTNTYTGGTRILAGTLEAAGGHAIGDQSSVFVLGGMFRILNDETIATLSSGSVNPGTVELAGGNLTTNTTGPNITSYFYGSITGPGGFIKSGTYRQVLAGDNSYSGSTQILGGTLLAVGAGRNSVPDTSLVTIADGATLSLVQPSPALPGTESDDEVIGSLMGAATSSVVLGSHTLTVNGVANTNFAGQMTGAGGSLVKAGAGVLTLTGVNSYTGGTTVAAGTLALSGPGQLDPGGSVSMAAGATFDIVAAFGDRTIGDLSGAGGSTINLGANRLIVGTSNDTVFGGTIQGSGGLTKQGSGELALTGTNTYTGETLVTGGTALAPSRLVISGPDATLGNTAANLTVGRFSGDNAALTIESGGVVSNNDGKIGSDPGSSGTAVVRGVGSTWTNTNNVFVGYNGTGSLTIEDGGRVSAHTGLIGDQIGSSGTVTVTGPGSQLSTTSTLAVGSAGTGTLTIENGGTVSAKDGWIGAASGSSGAVTVRGAGSTWTNSDFLAVANGGTGSLTIEDGGRVSNTFAAIGSSSSGTVVVRGAGSTWSNSSDLYVGYLGTGALTIADGGAVSAATTRLGHDASGQGSLTLAGSAGARGLLTTGQILKGAGSATLTLDGGILQATADQPDFLSNFAPGDVVVNAGGALIDSNGHRIGIAAALSGNGGLIKTGAGLLTLTGTSTLSGPSSILAGQLAVNGSLASSAVTVANAATLSGTGTIGGLSALSGATIAPGNSIGTLTVAGNVAFAAGSTYAVEINAAGQADRLAATGTATLAGGTVQVLPDQGTGYVANVPYTIVTATGVTGAFSGTTGGEFAFVTPTLGYRTNAVTLTLVRKTVPTPPTPTPTPVAFHSVAVTRNQYNTADGVEALGASNRLFDTVIGASVAGARQAFDALSGEAHASAISATYADMLRVQDTILNRLSQGGPLAQAGDVVPPSFDPRSFALWGTGFGSWGKVRSDDNAAAMDTSTGGFIIGADAKTGEAYRIGVAGGFTSTSFDIDRRLSSGTNESVFGSLYGAAQWDALNLRLGMLYAHHDVDVNRTVVFPGFSDRVGSSYDGSTLMAFGEVGYEIDVGGVTLQPVLGASIMRLHLDGFREEGGAAALTGYGRTDELGTTTLGLRAQTRIGTDLPLTLHGMAGWRHAFGDVNPSALLAFSGGASAFSVVGIPIDRNALVAEAGLDWQLDESMTLGVSYAGQIGERAQVHEVKGSFNWRFETR